MIFTINIPEETLNIPISDAVSRTVNSVVLEVVRKQLELQRSFIEKAVELYLSKRLTTEDIKTEIDKAVERIIDERLQS